MIKDILKEAEGRMKGAIQSLESDLAVIRTGRANPALVEKISVRYYDTPNSSRAIGQHQCAGTPLHLDKTL